MEHTQIAVSKNNLGDLEYDVRLINDAAMNHAIAPAALRAFAYDNIAEEMTAAELVTAYFDDKVANEEAKIEAECRAIADQIEAN